MTTRKKNVIAVMSSKGGVGKTVTTANLAASLALIFNKKILAIDTNVSTASLGLHFDVFYPENTLQDISGKKTIEKAIHVYHENLHLIPASIEVRKRDKDLKMVRENLHKAIKNYEEVLEDLSKKYDLILLDCSPGFDIEAIAAMHVAGGLIIVTNPDYPSIVTVARLIEYAKEIKMPVGGIVLNKVRKKKYELKREDIEEALGVKIISEIPYDKRIPESISKKKPVVLYKTNSKASKAYKKLAASLIGQEYPISWLKRILMTKKKIKK